MDLSLSIHLGRTPLYRARFTRITNESNPIINLKDRIKTVPLIIRALGALKTQSKSILHNPSMLIHSPSKTIDTIH